MPNTGTLSGLSASTAYALDAVHVDAFGNVSSVVSSAAFITDVAPPTSILFQGAGDLGTGTSATIAGGITTSGFHVLCLFNDDPSIGQATVTLNGVAPDGAVSSQDTFGGNVEIHYIAAATPGDIVVTTGDVSRAKSYALYRLDGFTAAGLISDEAEDQGPITLSAVPDGAAMIIAAGAAAGSSPGLPVITAPGTTEDGGHTDFPSLTVNSGTQSGSGDVTASFTGGANRFGLAGIAFPVA